MILELLFNVALLIFFIYCYIYIGIKAPEAVKGQMDGAQWPQILLALLIFFIGINIFKVVKNRDKNKKMVLNINLISILKNKLFLGCAILLSYALILKQTGFLFTSFIGFILYAYLLGEKRILRLFIYSTVCIVVLYIIFGRTLGIMLPRGTGIFRNFALFVESIGR